ncbi:hypothetical protein [Bradyrhizobium japonicum]|nr:hypothetical protein [Bradyrhizobium japonicum]
MSSFIGALTSRSPIARSNSRTIGSMLASIVKNIKRVMAAEYSRELSAKVYAGQCRFARLGYKPCGRGGYALVRELVDEKMQTSDEEGGAEVHPDRRHSH